MRARSEFTIPYLGLSNGSHHFQFELDRNFFSQFEMSKIEDGKFDLEVIFEKQDRMVVLEINCKGYYVSDCDRCLASIQIPMNFEDRVIIKLTGDKVEDKKDDIYYLDPKTSHIDLSPFLYESVHLYLPIKNVRDCIADGYSFCDQEVLKNLDANKETNDSSQGENPWEELRKLNLE